jgi:hypothetical protein
MTSVRKTHLRLTETWMLLRKQTRRSFAQDVPSLNWLRESGQEPTETKQIEPQGHRTFSNVKICKQCVQWCLTPGPADASHYVSPALSSVSIPFSASCWNSSQVSFSPLFSLFRARLSSSLKMTPSACFLSSSSFWRASPFSCLI